MNTGKENPPALQGSEGGAWTADVHKKLYPGNFNMGLASYICDVINPVSVLEFGSGLGHLAQYVKTNSDAEDVICIEPEITGGVYEGSNGPVLLSVDIFTQSHPEALEKQYDLVMSIEVAEHISRDRHDFLFDFLVDRAANWIVFSGARIGQGGHGHIAERDEEDWRSEFLERGLHFESQMTADIRTACDEKNINHRRNLMVFRK